MNLAVSDDGKTWSMVKALETDPGEYSYPAIIQAADGTLHVTYTWKRQKVKHLVLDPKGIR
jgi:predicted neuraminidase